MKGRSKTTLKRVEQCIKDNISDPNFNVNKLTELININHSYLGEIINKEHDLSPREFIEARRLEKAMAILSTEDISMIHLSCKCGFNTYKTFRNAAKRRFRMTPSDCRQLLISGK